MAALTIVITGTGTGIGKTYVAEKLVRALSVRIGPTAGMKPIESGVGDDDDTSDAARLERASSFRVDEAPPYRFGKPVSPHLAAREVGRTIDVATVLAWLAPARRDARAVVVELPGGLFSPLAPGLLNLDLLEAIVPHRTILVAPDRLGVLHDVIAATRAAAPRRFDVVLLNAPSTPDASTGSNAAELPSDLRVAGPVARDGDIDPAYLDL